MIRSESEYRDALSRSAKAADALAKFSRELGLKGLSPGEIENSVALMVSLQEDLQDEIRRYEEFREGDLSCLKSLREIGNLLIAARIARGLSQRDLSERLGIHESQVSRDEKNEYQGISCERASQILEVLSVELGLRAKLRERKKAKRGQSEDRHLSKEGKMATYRPDEVAHLTKPPARKLESH